MNVRILRVTGIRSTRPSVLAFVDGHRVRWRRSGWDCSCPDPNCGHVDDLADLLDERVLTDRRTAAVLSTEPTTTTTTREAATA